MICILFFYLSIFLFVTYSFYYYISYYSSIGCYTMDAKRVKLDSSLSKHLSIADPSLGHGFSAQIKRHYDLYYNEPQMNKKKLQHLVTTKVDTEQKIKWLELWNSTSAFLMSLKFPKMPISDKAFDLWLHKATFWSQIRRSC